MARKLAERGAALLVQALEMLRRGEAIRAIQDDSQVTYAPLITAEMRRINWEQPAADAANWIRGLDPRPGCYTFTKGKILRLFGARVKKMEGRIAAPGTALGLAPKGLEIACGEGTVTIAELQLAGHKRLPAAEFLRGQPLIKQVLG